MQQNKIDLIYEQVSYFMNITLKNTLILQYENQQYNFSQAVIIIISSEIELVIIMTTFHNK